MKFIVPPVFRGEVSSQTRRVSFDMLRKSVGLFRAHPAIRPRALAGSQPLTCRPSSPREHEPEISFTGRRTNRQIGTPAADERIALLRPHRLASRKDLKDRSYHTEANHS